MLLNKLILTYAVLYPIIFFGWNFVVNGFGHPEMVIPGFWLGMVAYALFNIFINTVVKRIF